MCESLHCSPCLCSGDIFVFENTPTPQLYTHCHTLSRHDARPISVRGSDGAAGLVLGALRAGGRVEPVQRAKPLPAGIGGGRSEEHTSELQSLMRISYAVFCLKTKNNIKIRPQLAE